MNLTELNITDSNDRNFLSNLYVEAFPLEERRDTDEMYKIYQNQTIFTIYLALQNKNYIGFLTSWNFNDFLFIEHFAVSSEYRNGGYGSKILNLFIEAAKHIPIILEVEPAVTDIAKRRIGFYKRVGFNLLDDIEYQQPSYADDGILYPMKLMSFGDIDITKNSTEIINKIHSVVYNYNNPEK